MRKAGIAGHAAGRASAGQQAGEDGTVVGVWGRRAHPPGEQGAVPGSVWALTARFEQFGPAWDTTRRLRGVHLEEPLDRSARPGPAPL
jgi:hypothetical protein